MSFVGGFLLSECPLSDVSLYMLCSDTQDAVYKYNVQYAFITVAPIACKHYPFVNIDLPLAQAWVKPPLAGAGRTLTQLYVNGKFTTIFLAIIIPDLC